MPKPSRGHQLREAYRFAGFFPGSTVYGFFGNPQVRVLTLGRRQKKTACGICGRWHRSFYDQKPRLVRDLSCGEHRIYLELFVRRVGCRSCGKVKRERLTWLADNPFMGYASDSTKRADRRSRCGFVHGIPTRTEFGWDGRGKAHLGAFATALRMSSRRL